MRRRWERPIFRPRRSREALCEYCETDYAFFASDGASAVEAAIKMALQYWQHVGEPQRTRFLRLVDAYHGDTTGAMSVSDIAVFKSHYGAITFETQHLRRSARPRCATMLPPSSSNRSFKPRPVCGWFRRSSYVPLRDCAPLVIVDEIATGFGRTGTMFAFEQLDLRPDLICLGQGHHRRHARALGRARTRAHLSSLSRCARRAQTVLSRALVRRQPDRVRGGACITRTLRARRHVRTCGQHRSASRERAAVLRSASGDCERFAKPAR